MISGTQHTDRTQSGDDRVGRPSSGAVLVSIVVLVVSVGYLAGVAGAVTAVLGFEEYSEGTELTNQYQDDGVVFQVLGDESAGAIVKTCDDEDQDCSAAWHGQNALVTPVVSGAERRPLVATFTEPQEEVWWQVRETREWQGPQVAELLARDASGTVVAETTVRFDAGTGWHRIGVSTESAGISEITLTLANSGFPENPHNNFVVDGLTLFRNEPPTPVIDQPPADPSVDESVRFDASKSFDPDSDIVRYSWDFDGDGSIDSRSSAPSVSYIYDEPGEYTVVLQVVDEDGLVGQTETTIRVDGPVLPFEGADLIIGGLGGIVGLLTSRRIRSELDGENGQEEPPEANIACAPEEPAIARPVLFDGSLSVAPDPDSRIVNYRWTVDERESAAPRFVHPFFATGEHDVELEVVDNRGYSGTQTETITVENEEGELVLDRVHPDAPGNDHETLDQEYLVFENAGDGPLELDGWTVHDAAEEEDRVTEGEHTFRFPDGFELDAGASVTIHTGTEPNDAGDFEDGDEERHLFWGKRRAVWNNDEDIVVVEDEGEYPATAIRYERTTDGEYDLEKLDVEILETWFPDITLSGHGEAPLLHIRVDLETGLAVISSFLGLVVGATFLRGPRAFLGSWADITGFLVVFLVTWGISTSAGIVSQSIVLAVPLLSLAGALVMLLIGGIALLSQYTISSLRERITRRLEGGLR